MHLNGLIVDNIVIQTSLWREGQTGGKSLIHLGLLLFSLLLKMGAKTKAGDAKDAGENGNDDGEGEED